jgi:hypothetical protein
MAAAPARFLDADVDKLAATQGPRARWQQAGLGARRMAPRRRRGARCLIRNGHARRPRPAPPVGGLMLPHTPGPQGAAADAATAAGVCCRTFTALLNASPRTVSPQPACKWQVPHAAPRRQRHRNPHACACPCKPHNLVGGGAGGRGGVGARADMLMPRMTASCSWGSTTAINPVAHPQRAGRSSPVSLLAWPRSRALLAPLKDVQSCTCAWL